MSYYLFRTFCALFIFLVLKVDALEKSSDEPIFFFSLINWDHSIADEQDYKEGASNSSNLTIEELLQEAQKAETEHNYSKAIWYFQQVLEKEPDNAEYNYQLGKSYLRNGKLIQASQYLSRAIELNAQFVDAKVLMGYAEYFQQHYQNSKYWFEQVILANPAYTDALLGLARVYKAMGNLDESIRCYEQALYLSRYTKEIRQDYAKFLSQNNLYLQAKQQYTILSQDFPADRQISQDLFFLRERTNIGLPIVILEAYEKEKDQDLKKWSAKLITREKRVGLEFPRLGAFKGRLQFSRGMQQLKNLISKTNTYSSNLVNIDARGTYEVTPQLNLRAQLLTTHACNKDAKSLLLYTKKKILWQPSVSANYLAENYRASLAFITDSMLIKRFEDFRVNLIYRKQAFGEYQYKLNDIGSIGVNGAYIRYHDPSRNREKDASLWAQLDCSRFLKGITLQYQLDHRSFKKQVSDYYSFHRRNIHWAYLKYAYIWRVKTRLEAYYGHGWSYTWEKGAVSQLNTSGGTSFTGRLHRQFLKIDRAFASVNHTIGSHFNLDLSAELSRDSQDYTTWSYKALLLWRF